MHLPPMLLPHGSFPQESMSLVHVACVVPQVGSGHLCMSTSSVSSALEGKKTHFLRMDKSTSHPCYLKIRVGRNSKLGSQTPVFFILTPESRGMISKSSFSRLIMVSTSHHLKKFRIAPDRRPKHLSDLRAQLSHSFDFFLGQNYSSK